MMTEPMKTVKVFLLYAQKDGKDESLRQDLEAQLSILKHQNLITIWNNQVVQGGNDARNGFDKERYHTLVDRKVWLAPFSAF